MKAKVLVWGILFILMSIAKAHAGVYEITFTCSPNPAAVTVTLKTLRDNLLPNNLCVYAATADRQLYQEDSSILTRVDYISWEPNTATAHLADGTTLTFPWGFVAGHKDIERVPFHDAYYVSIFYLSNNQAVKVYYPEGYEIKFFNAFEVLYFESTHINIVPVPKQP